MRPGRQASFAIRVPYTSCLLRFCRLREIVSPNTRGEVNAFPRTILPRHSRTPPTHTPATQFRRPGPESASVLTAQDGARATRQRRRDQHALPAVRREIPPPHGTAKPTSRGLPPYAKRRRSPACPAVRNVVGVTGRLVRAHVRPVVRRASAARRGTVHSAVRDGMPPPYGTVCATSYAVACSRRPPTAGSPYGAAARRAVRLRSDPDHTVTPRRILPKDPIRNPRPPPATLLPRYTPP